MAKISISLVKGKGSLAHNNREFITENVDRSRIKDNIIYKKESLTDAYKKCFGEVIEQYNKKQKRADRKIDGVKGYMEQVRTSGNGEKLFYENVVQVGNMHDCHVSSEQGQMAKEILEDYMKDFQERNPNLYVFNAVLHLDEQTPHLHIDYIPLGDGYTRGLKVRNSLDRAFKQQGIEGKSNKYENRTIAWQNREKDYIEKLVNVRGLKRIEDKGLKTKHKSVEHYKTVVNEVHNQVADLPQNIDSKASIFDKQKVTVDKNDLEQLERRASLSMVHEDATKKLLEGVTKSKEDSMKYVANKMLRALNEQDMAQKERIEVEKIKEDYIKLYKKQENLNNDYENLYADYEMQQIIIEELQMEQASLMYENETLKAYSEKVEETLIQPLKNQIEELRNHLRGSLKGMTVIIQAMGMLRHENNLDYKADLTKKQTKLIDAIRKYSKIWIEQNAQCLKDDTAKVCNDEIEKRIGISKGIKLCIEPDAPKRSRSRGHERG